MKLLKPTCFYHPTKILFLDDSQEFLDTLEMDFSGKLDYITETKPSLAREVLASSDECFDRLLLTSLDEEEADTITDRQFAIEPSNITNLIYDPDRFNYVSVLVVDYDMPDENGIDFCRSIQNRNIPRIILTAAADESTAVRAFNEGVIDKFLLKSDPTLTTALLHAIFEMRLQYFNQLSQTIFNSLSSDVKHLFETEEFQRLFCDTSNEATAVEHYLIDNSGSFLFLDGDGQPTWLIVRNNDELDRFSIMASGFNASKEVKATLKNKSELLFFLTEKDVKKPVREWGEYLFRATQLNDTNYYSIIQEKTSNSMIWDKVASYNSRS